MEASINLPQKLKVLETFVVKVSAAFVPIVGVKGNWGYLTQGSLSFRTTKKAEGLRQDPNLLL